MNCGASKAPPPTMHCGTFLFVGAEAHFRPRDDVGIVPYEMVLESPEEIAQFGKPVLKVKKLFHKP